MKFQRDASVEFDNHDGLTHAVYCPIDPRRFEVWCRPTAYLKTYATLVHTRVTCLACIDERRKLMMEWG